MKIAVPYEDGKVFQHFGRAREIKLYTVENGAVTAAHLVANEAEGHGAVTRLLKELGVNIVICGNIGGCAQKAVRDIARADDAVNAFLSNNLAYDPEVGCHEFDDDPNHTCQG